MDGDTETLSLEANAFLQELMHIQEHYYAEPDISKLFDYILASLLRITASEYGFIGTVLTDSEGKPYLKCYAITNISWDDATRAFYKKNAPSGLEFHDLDNLFGHTVKTHEVVISNDPQNDTRAGGLPKGHPPLLSYLGIPMFGREGLIAMVGLANRGQGYNEHMVKHLQPFISTLSSIIELTRKSEELRRFKQYDSLTQLCNRTQFERCAMQAITTHETNQQQFAMVLIDIDGFKKINDSFGHEVGDRVLIQFSRRLLSCLDENALVARLGDDEFAIILHQIPSSDYVQQIVAILQEQARNAYFINEHVLYLSCSVGIVCYPIAGVKYDTLLKRADFALQQSKKDGQVHFYFTELERRYQQHASIEKALLMAINQGGFALVFQPQFDIVTKSVIGLEALIRWQDSTLNNIGPEKFIHVAEEIGIACQLNRWVVQQTVALFSDYQALQPLTLAINISPQVKDFNTNINEVFGVVTQSRLRARNFNIELELTESEFMNIDDVSISMLNDTARSLGINIAIDDFGTRYSSLARLLQLRLSTVKIDKTFVHNLGDTDLAATAIIEAIIKLSQQLGFKVIAEGVETQYQLDMLRKLGCRYAQGYLLARPAPLEQLLKQLPLQVLETA